MPLIAQICMVIVTIVLVAMAVMAIRLMLQARAVLQSARISLAELPALIEEVKHVSSRADELLLTFARISGSVNTAASHFERLASHTSTLASSVLDEIERPVSQMVRIMRALRFGASHLVDRWKVAGRP